MKKNISLILIVIMLVSAIGFVPVYASDAVLEQVGNALFEEDFDDYTLDKEYTKVELKEKQQNITYGDAWNQKYKVEQTVDGKKYLSISAPATKGEGGGYKVDLTTPFTHGTLVAEMKVLPKKYTTYAWNYFVIQGENHDSTNKKYKYYTIATDVGNNIHTAKQSNGIAANDTGTASVEGIDLTGNLEKDAYGFWNLRLVMSRKSTSDNWSLTIYDVTSGKAIISNPNISHLSCLKNVNRIEFVDMYAGNNITITDQWANITDLKIYIPKSENSDYNIENLTFKVDGEKVEIMPASGNTVSVSGTVICEGTPSGIAFLAVYDASGNLKGFDKMDISEASVDLSVLSVTGLTIDSKYQAKLILLESLDTLRPLRVAEVLSGEQF